MDGVGPLKGNIRKDENGKERIALSVEWKGRVVTLSESVAVAKFSIIGQFLHRILSACAPIFSSWVSVKVKLPEGERTVFIDKNSLEEQLPDLALHKFSSNPANNEETIKSSIAGARVIPTELRRVPRETDRLIVQSRKRSEEEPEPLQRSRSNSPELLASYGSTESSSSVGSSNSSEASIASVLGTAVKDIKEIRVYVEGCKANVTLSKAEGLAELLKQMVGLPESADWSKIRGHYETKLSALKKAEKRHPENAAAYRGAEALLTSVFKPFEEFMGKTKNVEKRLAQLKLPITGQQAAALSDPETSVLEIARILGRLCSKDPENVTKEEFGRAANFLIKKIEGQKSLGTHASDKSILSVIIAAVQTLKEQGYL